MKIRYSLAVVFIASCANVERQDQASLYNEFYEFQKLVNADYQLATETKVSEEFSEHIEQTQLNMPAEFRSPFFKNLGNNFRSEHSHFEYVKGDVGCLTINGVSQNNIPETLSLYYLKENGQWVINRFMSDTHETSHEYYREASCPSPEELMN